VYNLLVKAMCAEACSAFQFLISIISLSTIFVMVLMIVMLAFGIHIYAISILVLSRLSSLNLILNLSIVKGSKCQSCVQSKQPRKPHKAAEERYLAPLELIHSDIYEMNGVLTKDGQRYFVTMIDNASRYCYICLLKTKDKALNYFKSIRLKLKIN
jgi:hypothetical protein